uniref:Cytosolic Fe-S cluster assembly factor NUBP2 homolog n=1 Tax=Phallusia mammillata TaxID=59560 RepID=A0A6F9DNC3_9ASCI|nr:cytosolic Fe-S cluster assembly factor NUBP2 homolog [Phallusia mammillata]
MESLNRIKNVILVLSGKGGVGKSTLSTQLALGLAAENHKVGLLDVDLCGPSIPRMLNLEQCNIHQCDDGWLPVYSNSHRNLSVMSIGFLLDNKNDPVIWRGPKKNAMIKQFLSDVVWGELDFLIIDTPPGTSDEHLAVVTTLKGMVTGAVLVTTPQAVAVADVQRELTFCRKTGIPVLGIVENMSGYVCPHCSECLLLFSQGGGEDLAKQENISFLGNVPIDPNLAECCDGGKNFLQIFANSQAYDSIKNIISKISTHSLIKH